MWAYSCSCLGDPGGTIMQRRHACLCVCRELHAEEKDRGKDYRSRTENNPDVLFLAIWFSSVLLLTPHLGITEMNKGFPSGWVGKNLPTNAGDPGDKISIPGLGRSPGGENGNPLQYSCLENPMDRGARWATVRGAAENQTWLRRSTKWKKETRGLLIHSLELPQPPMGTALG